MHSDSLRMSSVHFAVEVMSLFFVYQKECHCPAAKLEELIVNKLTISQVLTLNRK